MSEDIIKFGKSKVFFDTFHRKSGTNQKTMHYCPGCGHGILHKLIAEAIELAGIQQKVVFIAPVGCSVFAYYYFNCGGISVPHGRAPAVATGLARANPDSFVISYQGDGDLGAIGLNEFLQAANRGEKITVFFVNNATYGMTGGQMAPTTLIGQKTATTPLGRTVENDGYPMKICELVNALEAPIYIERVAMSTTGNILKTRKAVQKAINNLKEHKGFSLVEVLSGCPVNLKMNARDMNKFIDEKLAARFPLGCLRDRTEAKEIEFHNPPIHDIETVRSTLFPRKLNIGVADDFRNKSKIFKTERRIKVAGFGGQGILSLGVMLATMGKLRNFNVTWLPSYGPEQRGGMANCSIILSHAKVGSPMIDNNCNLLVAMNQPSLDKFLPELKPNGVLFYDSSTMSPTNLPTSIVVCSVPALEIAKSIGNMKYANAVILGALSILMGDQYLEGDDKFDFNQVIEEAIIDCFDDKPEVIKMNLYAFYEGQKHFKRVYPHKSNCR